MTYGFVLLLQVDLRLKVCRCDSSPRKVLVQEAKSFDVSTVILGSKTHHTIRSPASIAKYCAKKLPKCVSVFAVDNGKVAFRREVSRTCSDQGFNYFDI